MNAHQLLYRRLLKQAPYNRDTIRKMISTKYTLTNKQFGNSTEVNETKVNQLSENYLLMRDLIKQENELLVSYNLNIDRDNKKQIERTANYVGLKI